MNSPPPLRPLPTIRPVPDLHSTSTVCKHGAFFAPFSFRRSGSHSALRSGHRPPPGPLPCPLCPPGSGNTPSRTTPPPAFIGPPALSQAPFRVLSNFQPAPYFRPRPRGSDFLHPYLKNFCASAPAEERARVRRTRARERNSAPAGGARVGAAVRV